MNRTSFAGPARESAQNSDADSSFTHAAGTLFENPFPPPWADAWGDDVYGLWADLCLGSVVQRLRWIEPGQFLMGSPDGELERFGNEGPQHAVRISTGFWLADSACTQDLWLAVLAGDNPARFKDDLQCPVEQVSFDDVHAFLTALTVQLPAGSQATLPTEAQWEYACRAGSTTPFSFGVNITPATVNFDGGLSKTPEAPERIYREQTVPVKSLPPNAWGLHEMHGNVWEWCDDGQRVYVLVPAGRALVDPAGPREMRDNAHRAVRGGSWLRAARRCRSAYRNANPRRDRYDYLGFRLALRS